jgi:hypothetical protein
VLAHHPECGGETSNGSIRVATFNSSSMWLDFSTKTYMTSYFVKRYFLTYCKRLRFLLIVSVIIAGYKIWEVTDRAGAD